MAETLLSFGVEKLWNLLVRESKRFQGVEDQFDELKSELETLRCFVEDADSQKHSSATLKNTVKEIKEIVYDAEDIIETFLLKEELGKTNGIRKRIRQFAIIADRRGLAFNMEAISKRVSKVIRDMQSLGVQQFIVNERDTQSLQERQREMRQTFSSDNEDHLVGLEKNVEQLVGYLVEEASSQVVSIIGMGGIGKTTLARQVFHHEMVQNHFDGVAWVCISQQFTTKCVWQTILQKLSSKTSNMTEARLQEELFGLLETSNSLIVLDDMWKEEDWDRIKPVFPSKKGWKVLLTSRNENVALHADRTCVIFKQECLTPKESWTLFQRIAFPSKDTAEFKVDVEEMEDMGKQMIKDCGGLPLAVRVLGGLLAAQHTLSEWKRVCENIGSRNVGRTSITEKNISSVTHILSLSFEELPMYLKHCFLYFAHFPEDYQIDVGELSYYWAAEGIPRPRYYAGATIREVADGYIEELVRRNMVISKRDDITSRFETCHLHDIMREVCLLKAEEENFVHIVDKSASTATSQSPCKSRRIAVHPLDETYHLKWEMQNPKLRSLLFTKTPAITTWRGICFTRVQLMRVLDLSYAKYKGGKLPSSIGKLIHLRYLSLYWAKVSHLPSSMRNLKMLLYLNLNVEARSPLYMGPNFLKEMRELTYLYLPWNIHKKVKLELGNLVNLETLENFSTEHSSVRDLHRMTRLETLKIRFNGKGCTMETLSSSLSELRHLENLTIDGDRFHYEKDEEGFVLDCGSHLKQLRLTIYMPKLPDEQHFPSRLTFLDLKGCCLVEDPMPILEKLLHLKSVHYGNRSFAGRRMVCSGGGFPQLQKLKLDGLEEWEEWIVEEGSMPLLHTLSIRNCPKLKRLPVGGFPQLQELVLFGLGEWEEWIVEEGSMPLLHTLYIWYCPKLKRLPVGGFPQLQKLLIRRLDDLEEWIVEEGSMPLLHTLGIWDCPKLKELPDGLQFIYSLKELSMGDEWKEKLSEGGEEYYKVQHIPLVQFY